MNVDKFLEDINEKFSPILEVNNNQRLDSTGLVFDVNLVPNPYVGKYFTNPTDEYVRVITETVEDHTCKGMKVHFNNTSSIFWFYPEKVVDTDSE